MGGGDNRGGRSLKIAVCPCLAPPCTHTLVNTLQGAHPMTIHTLRHSASVALRALSGLCYPNLCLGCEARLPPTGARGDVPLCAPCLRDLPRSEPEALAERLARHTPPELVPTDGLALWQFDAGTSVQRLQHALKYGGRERMGVHLGRILGRAFVHAHPTCRIDAVVPVPLSRTRRLERGYNQSEALALGVAAASPGPAALRPDLLRRSRTTRTQTRLSHTKRWANVHGAFETTLTPLSAVGLSLLLVDDVVTTGATLMAAALPLIRAGADVAVAAMACVPD